MLTKSTRISPLSSSRFTYVTSQTFIASFFKTHTPLTRNWTAFSPTAFLDVLFSFVEVIEEDDSAALRLSVVETAETDCNSEIPPDLANERATLDPNVNLVLCRTFFFGSTKFIVAGSKPRTRTSLLPSSRSESSLSDLNLPLHKPI